MFEKQNWVFRGTLGSDISPPGRIMGEITKWDIVMDSKYLPNWTA